MSTDTTQIDQLDSGAEPAESGDEWIEEPRRRFNLLNSTPPWLISTIIHAIIVPCMAFITFGAVVEKDQVTVLIPPSEIVEQEEEFETLEMEEISDVELEVEEIEIHDMAISTEIVDPGQIAFGDMAPAPSDIPSETEVTLSDSAVDEIGALFGDKGHGMADVSDGLKAAASFFGAKTQGRKFVFVVDNSNSMGRGRFETALIELQRSVDSMSENQEFYVIFFSDTSYRMFHPRPAPKLIAATPDNKDKLRYWLQTAQMCLRTKGEEALSFALLLNPDVIYILGDGAFTDKTGAKLCAPHSRRVVINTLGMEVDERGRKELSAIAAANRGTYREVAASQLAKEMARKNPIKKNNKRGPVWGVDLPVNGKK